MHLHVCTRFTCDDWEDLKPFAAMVGLKPVNRLYLNSSKPQTHWSFEMAIGPNGRVQWYNPLRRRWTRTWFWFTLVPPRAKQLNPMKRPWQKVVD